MNTVKVERLGCEHTTLARFQQTIPGQRAVSISSTLECHLHASLKTHTVRLKNLRHCALEFILRAARAQRRRAPEVDRERYRAPRRILNCKTIHIHYGPTYSARALAPSHYSSWPLQHHPLPRPHPLATAASAVTSAVASATARSTDAAARIWVVLARYWRERLRRVRLVQLLHPDRAGACGSSRGRCSSGCCERR